MAEQRSILRADCTSTTAISPGLDMGPQEGTWLSKILDLVHMGYLEGNGTQQGQWTAGAEGEKVRPIAVEGSQECPPRNPTEWALLRTCQTRRQQHGLRRCRPNMSLLRPPLLPHPLQALQEAEAAWGSEEEEEEDGGESPDDPLKALWTAPA